MGRGPLERHDSWGTQGSGQLCTCIWVGNVVWSMGTKGGLKQYIGSAAASASTCTTSVLAPLPLVQALGCTQSLRGRAARCIPGKVGRPGRWSSISRPRAAVWGDHCRLRVLGDVVLESGPYSHTSPAPGATSLGVSLSAKWGQQQSWGGHAGLIQVKCSAEWAGPAGAG